MQYGAWRAAGFEWGKMKSNKALWIWAVSGVIAAVVLYNLFSTPPSIGQVLSYSQLVKEAEQGRVTDVSIADDD
jgi:FtsH Extracellular